MTGGADASAGVVTNHAWERNWFEDLLAPSRDTDREARRRAIVAAAAFLECYWIRWAEVRLVEAGATVDELVAHFTRDTPLGKEWRAPRLRDLWRNELSRLSDECRRIAAQHGLTVDRLQPLSDQDPSLDNDLMLLAGWRDALLHGKANRLRFTPTSQTPQPTPAYSPGALEAIRPDWPAVTAVALVRYPHSQDSTTPADWFEQAWQKLEAG